MISRVAVEKPVLIMVSTDVGINATEYALQNIVPGKPSTNFKIIVDLVVETFAKNI